MGICRLLGSIYGLCVLDNEVIMEIINQGMRVELENMAKKMNAMAKKIEEANNRIDLLMDILIKQSKDVQHRLDKERI